MQSGINWPPQTLALRRPPSRGWSAFADPDADTPRSRPPTKPLPRSLSAVILGAGRGSTSCLAAPPRRRWPPSAYHDAIRSGSRPAPSRPTIPFPRHPRRRPRIHVLPLCRHQDVDGRPPPTMTRTGRVRDRPPSLSHDPFPPSSSAQAEDQGLALRRHQDVDGRPPPTMTPTGRGRDRPQASPAIPLRRHPRRRPRIHVLPLCRHKDVDGQPPLTMTPTCRGRDPHQAAPRCSAVILGEGRGSTSCLYAATKPWMVSLR
jgi:hypothetical protein